MSVQVILEGLENNPQCLHGPCLLFRQNRNRSNEYYACSACRDRKECSFYVKARDARLEKVRRSRKWIVIRNELLDRMLIKNPYRKYLKMLDSLKSSDEKPNMEMMKFKMTNFIKRPKKKESMRIFYCNKCGILFDDSDSEDHRYCSVKKLRKRQLKCPTEIIVPKEDPKTNAQYYFTRQTVENIVLLLSRLKTRRVLCIGVPRVHEYLVYECENKIQSLLLDIDMKYYNFYNDSRFIWYNMFNNYILREGASKILERFLQSRKVTILLDPPFGGRTEPLAHTVNALTKLYCKVNKLESDTCDPDNLGIMWVFPYFMERHIKENLPDFNMFDLKIDYANHSTFTNTGTKKRKFGSPVRIFTNIPLPQLILEGVEGYKYCEECNYWVSQENRHCELCGACTSKNGQPYVHCRRCLSCVKSSYRHCESCGFCTFSDHICTCEDSKPRCPNCKRPGHRRRDCPQKDKKQRRKKRRTNPVA